MVSFEYTIPLRLPVGRRSDIGKLSGRVLDAEIPGRGLDHVLVKANDLIALTDERGGFVFHGVKPDTYYLSVEPKSASAGRVPLQDAPLSVSVEGQAEKTVEIAVARPGGIEGRIILVPGEEKDKTGGDTIPSGLGGTIVEARRDGTVYSQVSDDDGNFRFEDLRPGRWILAVDSEDLPEFTDSEKPAISVDVQPGRTAESNIRVLHRRREIQFVDAGEIVVGQEQRGGILPAPRPAKPSAPSAATSRGTVLLQAGVFSKPGLAEKMRRSIADLCPEAKVRTIVSAGRTLYRVIIPCPDTRSAENTLSILRARGVDAAPVPPAKRR